MPNYIAPVEDMLFLFEKLRDNKHYNEHEKYNEAFSNATKKAIWKAICLSYYKFSCQLTFENFTLVNTLCYYYKYINNELVQ